MPITINGSGTVTGISVGGLPDGIVDTDTIAANAVTLAKKQGFGQVLQYFVSTLATTTTTTSDADVPTGLDTGDFTPKKANSNFYCMAIGGAQNSDSTSAKGVTSIYYRSGSATPGFQGYINAYNFGAPDHSPHSGALIHNPSTSNGYTSGTMRFYLYMREVGSGQTYRFLEVTGGQSSRINFVVLELDAG